MSIEEILDRLNCMAREKELEASVPRISENMKTTHQKDAMCLRKCATVMSAIASLASDM